MRCVVLLTILVSLLTLVVITGTIPAKRLEVFNYYYSRAFNPTTQEVPYSTNITWEKGLASDFTIVVVKNIRS